MSIVPFCNSPTTPVHVPSSFGFPHAPSSGLVTTYEKFKVAYLKEMKCICKDYLSDAYPKNIPNISVESFNFEFIYFTGFWLHAIDVIACKQ